MNNSRCYNCSSDKNTFYAEENGFVLVKCESCGLLYVENPPCDSDISQAHKQGLHEGLNKINVTGRFNPEKISNYLDILKDLFEGQLDNNQKWLDIGCGYGEFLLAIQEYSSGEITVKGTEPNIYKQESARRKGLNVSYFDVESHKEKYDVISILNVYSHLPDPPVFLKTVKELLKPDGELIIETGDTANFLEKFHPHPFYLPDHLSFASEEIVKNILEKLGFEIICIKKYPFLQVSFKSFGKEVIKFILPKYKSNIRYFLGGKMPRIDMFIRARIKH